MYESHEDIRNKKVKVGKGVYFSNHIEVAESYAKRKSTLRIGDFEYTVVF